LCPFDGLSLDIIDTLLVTYPFLQVEPFLEERLGFVACHFKRKDPVEEIPNGLDILLDTFHVHVDGPEIPSFGMRIDDSFEESAATFGVAKLILELSKPGYRFEVYEKVNGNVVGLKRSTYASVSRDFANCVAVAFLPLQLFPFAGRTRQTGSTLLSSCQTSCMSSETVALLSINAVKSCA
jgi:hypothetical protein